MKKAWNISVLLPTHMGKRQQINVQAVLVHKPEETESRLAMLVLTISEDILTILSSRGKSAVKCGLTLSHT